MKSRAGVDHSDKTRHRAVKCQRHNTPPPQYKSCFVEPSNKPHGRLSKKEFATRQANEPQPPKSRVVFDNGDTDMTDDHLREMCELVYISFDPEQTFESLIDVLAKKYKKLVQVPGPKGKVVPAFYRRCKIIQKRLQRRGANTKFKGHDKKRQHTEKTLRCEF
jgi:hypothetical protein